LAVKSLLPLTVKLYEGLVETCEPYSVQFKNTHPIFAIAFTVACEPELYDPAPVVYPPIFGLAFAVIVY
jgi:hypothetical protein